MLNGGESGPVIVPGKPAESRLLRGIRQVGKLKMPPRDKLSGQVAANFANGSGWARLTRERSTAAIRSKVKSTSRPAEVLVVHPAGQANTPPVKDSAWPRGEIDHFVLSSWRKTSCLRCASHSPRAHPTNLL
ncbi:MAG: hypothetical protein CM1200mP29_14560 [Verrucomicrobiota bacterium]|nr:MAG: hypothetical protein CM1200mP29_14560 [Verrucomicrobiota bacterium]